MTETQTLRGPKAANANMESNSYEKIDRLLRLAKAGDEDSMGELILCLDPLIKNQIRHYFSRVDEDYLQMGRLRALELIQRFDMNMVEIRFLGYMSRFLSYYFWDQSKKAMRIAKHPCIAIDEEEIARKIIYYEDGFSEVELNDLLSRLPEDEAYVVHHHILQGKSLVTVAEEMGLTRDQVRYIKKKCLDSLHKIFSQKNIPPLGPS